MRRRDAQALIFCAVLTAAVFTITLVFLRSLYISLGATAVCAVILYNLPRLRRVRRRLRGSPDWSGYYKD